MHTIATLISDLGFLFLGFVLGANLTLKAVNRTRKKIAYNNFLPLCFAEYLEGNYYLYSEKSKFLCQSPTIDGLAKALSEIKKINIAFVVTNDGDHEMFWFAGGKARPADLAGLEAMSSELK